MKQIKLISQDEPNINSLIHELKCDVDHNNNVLITWDWPGDTNIKMVVIFQVSTGEEDLAELLAKDSVPVIVTKSMERSYNRQLESEKAIFKIFPACFGKNGEVLILNQKENNTTKIVYAKIPIYYSVVYKSIPFSQMQRVFIKIEVSAQYSFMPVVNVEDLLVYEKNANGYTITYPVDDTAVSNGMTLYVRKNEKIHLKPKALYENIVSLHEEV